MEIDKAITGFENLRPCAVTQKTAFDDLCDKEENEDNEEPKEDFSAQETLRWILLFIEKHPKPRLAVDVLRLLIRDDMRSVSAVAIHHGLTREAVRKQLQAASSVLKLETPDCLRKTKTDKYNIFNRRNSK